MSNEKNKKVKAQKGRILGRIVAGAMIVFMLLASFLALIYYLINK